MKWKNEAKQCMKIMKIIMIMKIMKWNNQIIMATK